MHERWRHGTTSCPDTSPTTRVWAVKRMPRSARAPAHTAMAAQRPTNTRRGSTSPASMGTVVTGNRSVRAASDTPGTAEARPSTTLSQPQQAAAEPTRADSAKAASRRATPPTPTRAGSHSRAASIPHAMTAVPAARSRNACGSACCRRRSSASRASRVTSRPSSTMSWLRLNCRMIGTTSADACLRRRAVAASSYTVSGTTRRVANPTSTALSGAGNWGSSAGALARSRRRAPGTSSNRARLGSTRSGAPAPVLSTTRAGSPGWRTSSAASRSCLRSRAIRLE